MFRGFSLVVAFLGLLLGPAPLHGQDDANLLPEDGPFSPGPLWSYTQDVRKLLSRGMRDIPLAYMACIPSFEPEWVVYIQQPQPDPRKPYPRDMLSFFVVCERANTQIWDTVLKNIAQYPEIRDRIKTTVSLKRIPDHDAHIIVRAFLVVLAKTRYSGKRAPELDGVSYHFSARDVWTGVEMFGQSQDPKAGSTPGTMVALGKTMAEYTRAIGGGTADSLLARMRDLAARLTK